MRYTPMRCTTVICTPMICTPMRLLERQAPGHVTALMQDILSDIISLQFNKYLD
jgi:hypothetical protein